MNYRRSFRFTLLATLLAATALPVYAKKGDEPQDCDDTSSDIALQGSLAVQSSTQLNACTTVTQASGVIVCTAHGACPRIDVATGAVVELKEEVPVTLAIASTTIVCPDGGVQTLQSISGVASFVSQTNGIWWNGNSNPNPGVTEVEINGMVMPDGQLVATLTQKNAARGINSPNLLISRMAAVTGNVLFNPKEYSLSAKGHKTGHVSLLKQ